MAGSVVTRRFQVRHPPIPRDAISDELTREDPPSYVAVVPIGHADAWIAGAEYEAQRISDALWSLIENGGSLDEDGEVLRLGDVLELLGPDEVEAWRRAAARNAGIGDA